MTALKTVWDNHLKVAEVQEHIGADLIKEVKVFIRLEAPETHAPTPAPQGQKRKAASAPRQPRHKAAKPSA